jgi:hypothetical protein
MTIDDNKHWALLNHSTRTIESHILHTKPFQTDGERAFVIAFTTYRIGSTKKSHCQEVNDSWQDAQEAYGFKVLWYIPDEKATTYMHDFNNFLRR